MGEVYSSAGLVFSNRLHILLLGVLYGGIPFAVIDADEQQKISGMFNDMQFNHLIVDVRHGTFNGEHVLNVLQDYSAMQGSHSRRRRMLLKINDLYHSAFVNIKPIESTTYAFTPLEMWPVLN